MDRRFGTSVADGCHWTTRLNVARAGRGTVLSTSLANRTIPVPVGASLTPNLGATPNTTDQLLDLLPAAVYVCAPDGTILRFNRRAAELWGRAPLLSDPRDRFCGAYRLYQPDGELLPHEKCPMADILRDGIPVMDRELVIERPDGSRGVALVNIRPLKDAAGNITGAVNCFYDITERKQIDQENVLTRGQVEELTVKLAQERGQQLALHEFTDRLYRADSQQVIHEAALEAITGALGCERASILLFDEAGIMRFVAWRGLSDAYRQAVDGHSPWTRDTKNPQPICIENAGSADLADTLKATVKAEGISALAFIPLTAKGVLVGKFMTYFKDRHVFSDAEIALAVTIARQLGFSVERKNAVDAEHRAHARQDFLARELHHRTKNMFSVVQAVVARSFDNKHTIREAETAVMDRLHSLAQTHSILLDTDWQGANLAEVARIQMRPYGDRVKIQGPSLMLTAQAAQNFALALHELATNAAKYGALSNDTGGVSITWSVTPNGSRHFIFRWQESGGPHVTAPTVKGFGSAVLEQVMAEYFENPPRIEFAADGVGYEVVGSLEAITISK
jgi:two-component sensor histidine kinase